MPERHRGIVVLIADDDDDDRLLTAEAWDEARSEDQLVFVNDGQQLLEYLETCSAADNEATPYPDILLLDLNMPRLDGLSALRIIKHNPDWRTIPVVILTTSQALTDIETCYEMGANSFITKPTTYSSFVEIISTVGDYWSGVVALPTSIGA